MEEIKCLVTIVDDGRLLYDNQSSRHFFAVCTTFIYQGFPYQEFMMTGVNDFHRSKKASIYKSLAKNECQ